MLKITAAASPVVGAGRIKTMSAGLKDVNDMTKIYLLSGFGTVMETRSLGRP